MQKDILLLSAFPPPEGGIATWTLSFLDYCQKKRVSIDTVDISMNGTRKSRAVNSKRNILDEIPRTFHIFSCVIRMLKNNSYSVFHINSSCSSFGIIRDYISVLMARKHIGLSPAVIIAVITDETETRIITAWHASTTEVKTWLAAN